jgi:hypothetical protein
MRSVTTNETDELMKTRNAIENGQTPNRYVSVCLLEAVKSVGDDAITIVGALRG